jgi:hypothetical protein
MALILARGRRRDRFGQCLVGLDDVESLAADALVHATAAALRRELARSRGEAAADFELTNAAEHVLSKRDPERGLTALTSALVRRIVEAGGVSDDFLLAAANEGEVAFVAEVLAERGHLPVHVTMDELLSGEADKVMMLLRLTRVSNELVAGLLAALGDLLGVEDAGAAMGIFHQFTDAELQAARAWLLSAPSYRTALGCFGQHHG